MPETILNKLQITLNTDIGQFSEPRHNSLLEALGPGFAPQQTQMPGFLGYINNDSREGLFVSPQQTIYVSEADPISPESARSIRALSAFRDGLLLGDAFTGAVQWIGKRDANGASTESSVDNFLCLPGESLRKHFGSHLRGVGLRFTFEEAMFHCDLRIEPLFADPAYFYMQFDAVTGTGVTLDQILTCAYDSAQYLQGKTEELMQQLLAED
ncbi:MAG: hypothetical protein ACYC1M_17625 [Armatimonadota bacterium]